MSRSHSIPDRATVVVIVLVLTLVGAGARGAEFRSGEKVVVESDQVVEDDLYMTGDTMTIKGRVRGDVVAAGRIVRVEGEVEGDLVAAAQVVEIVGQVLDDVRIAGLTLRLAADGSVGDDLFAAGFSFESESGGTVMGRTGLTGYQARLGGDHHEGVEASLVGLAIAGGVAGDVRASVDSEAGSAWWMRFIESPVPMPTVPAGLSVADGARITGDLVYVSAAPASIAAGANIEGDTTRDEPQIEPPKRVGPAQRLASALRRFVVLMLFGSALFWLAPRSMSSIAQQASHRLLPSLGWGLVTSINVPVAMILVLVLTLVLSMAFGLLTLRYAVALVLVLGVVLEILLAAGFWMVLAVVVPTAVGYALGRWLWQRFSGGTEPSRYSSLAVGLLILVGLGSMPVLGAVVRALVIVLGLGAVALWVVGSFGRSAPPTQPRLDNVSAQERAATSRPAPG